MLRCFIIFFTSFLITVNTCFCQVDSSAIHTVFLIGDAGEISIDQVAYKDTLLYELAHSATSTSVIFLGDNIYPNGMLPKTDLNRNKAESILASQIKLIENRVNQSNIYFLPGNHDWAQGKKNGLQHILLQQQWFDSLNDSRIMMLPRNGCPGPVEVSLSNNITLVILDTQWQLHKWDKPEGKYSTCQARTFDETISQLQTILQRNKHKRVIVAAHHPVMTYGEHGGVYLLKQHIFPLTDLNPKLYIPLPVIGSIYVLYRKLYGHRQDIANSKYKSLRRSLMKVLEQYPGIIYASGHDHSLQYIFKDKVHYIVSGAGVKTSVVRKKGYSKFAAAKRGFVKLSYNKNGETSMEYFSTDINNKPISLHKQILK